MAKHGKAKYEKAANRTNNGKKFSEMTPEEKAEEMKSSLGNPTQYAKDNFNPLKVLKGKHSKTDD